MPDLGTPQTASISGGTLSQNLTAWCISSTVGINLAFSNAGVENFLFSFPWRLLQPPQGFRPTADVIPAIESPNPLRNAQLR